MNPLNFDHSHLLLDGGMGRELRFRGIDILKPSWSAGALLANPDIVRQVHLDYIQAGADIITTNTYGIIRSELRKEGIENRYEDLNIRACKLAVDARKQSTRTIWIAGSLPPLYGSYRPDLVKKPSEMIPLYLEQAKLLAPYVDLFLCETLSSSSEARSAAIAAAQCDKPVWISWTLHQNRSGCLRSGETIESAVNDLAGLSVTGTLFNCCSPESITHALPGLIQTKYHYIGGYANTFSPIPDDWTLDGDKPTAGFLNLRSDLDPDAYGTHALAWLNAGANVIGGCCGTRPAHIAKLRRIINRFETKD